MVDTSITAQTPADIFYRTGKLTVNGVSVGALEGDNVFSVRRTYDKPELAGAVGEIKGLRHILTEEAFFTATLTAWDLGLLNNAIQGVDISSDASSQVMGSSGIPTNSVVGCIDSADYFTLKFEGTQCDGHKSTITMSNVIADGDFELTFRDKGHFTCPVTFKATYNPADPDSRTWAITHITA